LAKDIDQPAIARATALDLLRGYGPGDILDVELLASDENAIVRERAAAILQGFPPDQSVPILGSLLDDPIRAVRIEAVRVLASVPPPQRTSISSLAFGRVFVEFEEAQRAAADTPGAHLNLGATYAAQGDAQRAEQQYRTAIRLEPEFLPARFNLATLYNQLGRNSEAEVLLRETVLLAPDAGEAHYSLGLLLAEEQRISEALDSLRRATELLPERARVRYNYGLALQHLGRRAEAEQQFLVAYRTEPLNLAIVNALTTFYLQIQDFPAALQYAERLSQLAPDAPEPRQLIQALREQLGR